MAFTPHSQLQMVFHRVNMREHTETSQGLSHPLLKHWNQIMQGMLRGR